MFIFILAAATIYIANQAKGCTSRIVICFHRRARKQEVRFLPETQILCLSTYNELRYHRTVVEYYRDMWSLPCWLHSRLSEKYNGRHGIGDWSPGHSRHQKPPLRLKNANSHASTYRILLRKAGSTRIAIMIDSANHAYDQTRFAITEARVQEVQEYKSTGSEW